jgi:chromate transport protein ChrA
MFFWTTGSPSQSILWTAACVEHCFAKLRVNVAMAPVGLIVICALIFLFEKKKKKEKEEKKGINAPGECRSVGDDNNRCCVARSA